MTDSGWRSVRGRLALGVCLVLAMTLVLVRPDPDRDRFTVLRTGADGWGRTTAFDARIERVGVTTVMPARVDGDPVPTEQRWVVVDYTVRAHRERLDANRLWLITAAGDRYAARPEFAGLGVSLLDAGFTGRGIAVFEVPPEAIAGLTVRVGPVHTDRRPWDVVVEYEPTIEQVPAGTAGEPVVEVTR